MVGGTRCDSAASMEEEQRTVRDVDVVVIGDAFVDILAPVHAMPQWGQDREASSIRFSAFSSASSRTP